MWDVPGDLLDRDGKIKRVCVCVCVCVCSTEEDDCQTWIWAPGYSISYLLTGYEKLGGLLTVQKPKVGLTEFK